MQDMDKPTEAEQLFRRAIAIHEKSLGPDSDWVATELSNLGKLLKDLNRLADAEPALRRALSIHEKIFGPDHFSVSQDLTNLGGLLRASNRLAEAEPLMRRALAIDKKSFGPNHPNVAYNLNNLASLKAKAGDWPAAVAIYARAKEIVTREQVSRANLLQNSNDLRAYARALYHADRASARNRAEAFEAAQSALQTSAAEALSSMAARFAKGGGNLAKIVREQQDLAGARQDAYHRLDQAAGRGDATSSEATRKVIANLEKKLEETAGLLAKEFPEFSELSNPKPVAIAAAQQLLKDKQAMVFILDVPKYRGVPEETIVFALTKKQARWMSLPFGNRIWGERLSALRCGLDVSRWQPSSESRDACKGVLNTEFDAASSQVPPFDTGLAHDVYRDLFGWIEDLIRGKSLLIVPSGAFTQMPFEVLVTAKPDGKLARFDSYKTAAWLAV
jgi:tetratricopeptide (TPR) repeat protein